MNQSATTYVTYRQMVTWIISAIGGATAIASIVMAVCTTVIVHALDNYPTLREIDARFGTVTEQVASITAQTRSINERITELRADLIGGRIGAVGEANIDGQNMQYVVVFLDAPETGAELHDQRIRDQLARLKEARDGETKR